MYQIIAILINVSWQLLYFFITFMKFRLHMSWLELRCWFTHERISLKGLMKLWWWTLHCELSWITHLSIVGCLLKRLLMILMSLIKNRRRVLNCSIAKYPWSLLKRLKRLLIRTHDERSLLRGLCFPDHNLYPWMVLFSLVAVRKGWT